MTSFLKAAGTVAAMLPLLAVSVTAQEYRVVGMVLKVDRTQPRVVVSHEQVPGLMGAMTMAFPVRDAKDLDGLVPGNLVEFTLVVTNESSYATRIVVKPNETMELDPLNARRLALLNRITRAGPPADQVALGQAIPDFTLTNQNHRKVSVSQLKGKVVALNFLYTNCGLPQFCLRIANNFGVLQKRFAREMGRDLVLLSVTFDPAHDTPEVLANYASQWKANPATWHFLTGEVHEVQRVCQMFGMDFFPNEGLMDHSLRTAVLDRSGRLVANVEGNQFTAGQLGDLIQIVLDAPIRKRP
jgi:protein SCO1/2